MKLSQKRKEVIKRIQVEINHEISLLDRLRKELDDVSMVLKEKSVSALDLRAAGSILHDFYNGIENVFRRIAQELNGSLPEGEDWHRQLLVDMGLDIKGIRPAVISEQLRLRLQRYLGFRHIFRNIYGFSLEENRIKELVEEFPGVWSQFKKEISLFQEYLSGLAK